MSDRLKIRGVVRESKPKIEGDIVKIKLLGVKSKTDSIKGCVNG